MRVDLRKQFRFNWIPLPTGVGMGLGGEGATTTDAARVTHLFGCVEL